MIISYEVRRSEFQEFGTNDRNGLARRGERGTPLIVCVKRADPEVSVDQNKIQSVLNTNR